MHLYLRALAYYRPDIRKLALLLSLSATGIVLALLAPWPLAVAMDSLFNASPGGDKAAAHPLLISVLPTSTAGAVVALALLTLLIRLGQEVLKLAHTMTQHSLNYGVLLRVRHDLFARLQSMTPLEHGRMPEGDAVYRLCFDAGGPSSIVNTLIAAAIACLLLIALTATMLATSVSLTLITLAVTPVLVTANLWYGRVLRQRGEAARQLESRVIGGLQRTMSAISLVQAFGRESFEAERFQGAAQDSVRAWLRLHWQEVSYWLIIGTSFSLGTAAVFGYGGLLVMRGRAGGAATGALSAGDLVVFLSYMGMLFDPLCKLTGLSANLAGGATAAKRIFEVLDHRPPVLERVDAQPLPLAPRTLELRGAKVGYDKGRPVLNGVDIVVRPGEVVALVGPSGGGKSTLISLLARFMDPEEGGLYFDGLDARDLKLADVRRHLAVVLQDPVLLPASVYENIAYGRTGASLAEVREAARRAGAEEFILSFEKGYYTAIGREGVALSGGQRQRIALARALLSPAPFLVLDEPTSALDAATEALVTQTLEELRGKRSVILVTHRPAPLAACDRIYLLREGRIVQPGPPEQAGPGEDPAVPLPRAA